jgi:succinate dehydrogenase / fumarate reductase, iron-sulfur subunit
MNPSSEPTNSKTYRFEILRYDASADRSPRFQTYAVAPAPKASVLETLLQIQAEQDPSLAFRYACRGAVCGSCAMSINGKLNLACRVQVADLAGDRVVLEPLPHLEILKDLVVDMAPFWDKYERIRPWLHQRTEEARSGRMSDAEREKIDQYVNCILCGLCYASCPAVSADENFTGPAALAKLHRFLADSREDRAVRTLDTENRREGMWGCRAIGRCVDVCPKDVRPRDGIAAVRRRLLADKFKSLPSPFGRGVGGEGVHHLKTPALCEKGPHPNPLPKGEGTPILTLSERPVNEEMGDGKIDDSHIARRRYLCGMIAGGAAAMASGALVPLLSYLGNLREEPPPPFIRLPRDEWELRPGTSKLFRYGPIPALLIRTPAPEAATRIFVATCTHFDCIVGYRPEENHISCACHGGIYDLEGAVVSGPPPRPLRPLYFRVKQGDLWIALEEEDLEKALRQAEA